MNELTTVALLALPLGAVLLWILLSDRRVSGSVSSAAEIKLKAVLPRHFHYFPQIRQALSDADEKYLLKVASPQVAQQALRQRREVARRFLDGLREDFVGLEQVARMVATLSPVISRSQETERLLLGLQFHFYYRLVRLRILTGRVPLEQIQHLTELVGRLTARMEQAMTAISALSADQLSSELPS